MHKDYLHKIRKSLSHSKQIVPSYFETFYSALKACCQNIPTEDVTPEMLQKLSGIYNHCRSQLQGKYSSERSIPEEKQYREDEDKKGIVDTGEEGYLALQKMLSYFSNYLPNDHTSKTIFQHFTDNQFYKRVQQEKDRAQQLVKSLNSHSQSGDSTPIALHHVQGLNTVIQGVNKSTGVRGSKLHINGNNQISVIFWLNNFKMDYAVHFDIFWGCFIQYLNTVLDGDKDKQKQKYYSHFIPLSSNFSIKNEIRQLVDPDKKYYITSANCNQLFIALSEPQKLHLLAELTTTKAKQQKSMYSLTPLRMRFRWTLNSSSMGQSIGQGNVHAHDFYGNGDTLKSKDSSGMSQIGEEQEVELNGNCTNFNSKIFHNKYPPTVRFGSLTDNEICIKNKYVSRRQFMIIEQPPQLFILDNNNKDRNLLSVSYHSQSIDGSVYQKVHDDTIDNQTKSKYFLVCLSPSNYTAVVYPKNVQVTQGMIFKVGPTFIQITKVMDSYKGISESCNSGLGQGDSVRDRQEGQLGQSSNKNQKQIINQNNESIEPEDDYNVTIQSAHMLTIPASKLTLQESSDSEQIEHTLAHLPTKKYKIMVQKCIQCMFLNGQNKNKKIIISQNHPKIQGVKGSNGKQFSMDVEDGQFYLKAGTLILAKTANQVISGHLSDKVQLSNGMKIVLQQVQFQIQE